MNTATQTTLRITGRLLSGSTYALLGYDAARTPGGRVAQAASTLAMIRKVLPLPDNDELIVRANGALQATAGTTLALGLFPRSSATVLAVSLVPTTLSGHGFWALEDPVARKIQRTQFIKNMAMLGGLVFIAALERPSR